MFTNGSQISFSNPFLMRLRALSSRKEISSSLSDYAKRYKFEECEVNYFFIKAILNNGFYFQMDEEIVKELLFDAIYWASIKETKQKIKPKNFNDVKDKKVHKYYTKLMTTLVNSLVAKHFVEEDTKEDKDMKLIKFNLELSKYMELMYELSCIKRNRHNSKK